MRYCRFRAGDRTLYGLIESLAGKDLITRSAYSPLQLSQSGRPPKSTDHAKAVNVESLPLAEAKLAAPVRPSKIVCVGRNYREHAEELGNEAPSKPLIFLKPPSAIIGPEENIVQPRQEISQRMDFEGELALVVGKRCRNLGPEADGRSYIRGFTLANDVTARDLQSTDGQWTRAKGFDTFCPVGPMVSDEVDPWRGMEIETWLNGVRKQQGNTRDFIFSLDEIIRFISQVMTLLPGDLVLTGTPAGVAPMQTNDNVEVKAEGLGVLRNKVVPPPST